MESFTSVFLSYPMVWNNVHMHNMEQFKIRVQAGKFIDQTDSITPTSDVEGNKLLTSVSEAITVSCNPCNILNQLVTCCLLPSLSMCFLLIDYCIASVDQLCCLPPDLSVVCYQGSLNVSCWYPTEWTLYSKCEAEKLPCVHLVWC